MPVLDIYKNYSLDHRFSISKKQITIGRDISSDLILCGDAVSRTHALIKYNGKCYSVIDKSSNGTYLNGKKIGKGKLKDKDVILIDEWKLLFSTEAVKEENKSTLIRHNALPEKITYQTEDDKWLRYKILLQVFRPHCNKPEELLIIKQITTIGRARDNDIILDYEYVAGYASRIVVYGDKIYFENISLVNGTFVDERIEGRTELQNNSIVELGKIIIKVKISPSGEETVSEPDYSFHGIITKDVKMRLLFDKVKTSAALDDTVCIIGESGTGKELIANALHSLSRRAKEGHLISVNCSAIPAELIESELFGHERGAFTGAVKRRMGAFTEASGGTIFLDEIGELDFDLQAKLLRAIQNKSVKPIGSNREIGVDVRIVVATNKNLDREVEKGNFREDLYFRINVIRLMIPPLRERRDDIPLLVEHFIKKRTGNDCSYRFSRHAYEKVMDYDWPGNVRELETVVARALAFCKKQVIRTVDLEITPSSTSIHNISNNGECLTWSEMEKMVLTRTLQRFNNNRTMAAKALGLPKTTLYAKLKKYNSFHKKV